MPFSITTSTSYTSFSFNITQTLGRIVISDYDEFDESLIVKELQTVFGLIGISKATEIETSVENIYDFASKITLNGTFRVNVKRADKKFPLRSMDMEKKIGEIILNHNNVKVDLHNPEHVVYVEIRLNNKTYIYYENIKCAGGLPLGSAGKGLLLLSGGIDSPVAGYLTLKRGVNVECLYFESPPHTSTEAKNKVIKLASIINEYSGKVKVHVVPFTEIQEAIYKNCPDIYMITIMRRMMYRIAALYAEKIGAKRLINGESIGQVASQTLDSMVCINNVTNMPVIRPVACFDKLEIIDIAKKINTYETSILPYEDCCTIFVPKHPVIKPELEKCIEYESNFDYQTLIEKCINNIETITNFEENFDDLL